MAGAAAVRSCFSAGVTPCIQPRHPPADGIVRVAGLRALRLPNVACTVDGLGISCSGASAPRWRLPRVCSAAVAQEEAAAAAVDGEPAGENGGSETEAGEERANTKLYFGNLPYNCDSAQLAGIIQEYATPEMVEVRATWSSCGPRMCLNFRYSLRRRRISISNSSGLKNRTGLIASSPSLSLAPLSRFTVRRRPHKGASFDRSPDRAPREYPPNLVNGN